MKYVTALLSLSLFVACFPSSARAQTSTIVLVQRANKDAGTATSATLAFNSNNTRETGSVSAFVPGTPDKSLRSPIPGVTPTAELLNITSP